MSTLAGVTCSAGLLPSRTGRIFWIGGCRTVRFGLLVPGLSFGHDILNVFGATVFGRGRTRVAIFDIRGRHDVISRPSRSARSCRLHNGSHEDANSDTTPKNGSSWLEAMTQLTGGVHANPAIKTRRYPSSCRITSSRRSSK